LPPLPIKAEADSIPTKSQCVLQHHNIGATTTGDRIRNKRLRAAAVRQHLRHHSPVARLY